MRTIIFTGLALLFVLPSFAQSPPIVFNKEISDGLTTIIASIDHMTTAFGKDPYKGSGTSTSYQSTIKVGEQSVILKEYPDRQRLQIFFSDFYYKGSKQEFRTFYDQLLIKLKELLPSTYTGRSLDAFNEELHYVFESAEKKNNKSVTSVYTDYTVSDSGHPNITVTFYYFK